VSRVRIPLLLLTVLALLAVGCGDDEEPAEDDAVAVSAEDCQADALETVEPGKLTVATDKPAYPPYFIDDDPTNGKGFESAVAFAIAEQLGFSESDVEWVVEPFNSSYAPGPKDFDFDVNQISITPKRAEQVDFSTPYYTAEQAVVAPKGSVEAAADSLSDLADAEIGVQIGTTSLEAVEASIQPEAEPQVFDTSNDVVSALEQEQVDAIVVDVPTAFYLTSAQVEDAEIVGQFPAPGGDEWGALLEKGSPLTECVSWAIEQLRESGELERIEDRWMSQAANAPVLE
jgi:polar amino acid transport system substrate-binding protein